MRRRSFWLLSLWPCWLSAEYLFLGAGSYVTVFDNGDGLLPIRLARYGSWYSPQYWQALPAAGTDGLATALSGDWLIDALFRLAPGWLAYGLLTFGQRFIAGYFVFRIARVLLGASELGALFAGFSFAMFSYNWLNYAWAGFNFYIGCLATGPLLIWTITKLGEHRQRNAMLGGLCLGAVLAFTSVYYMGPFALAGVFAWVLLFARRSLSTWTAVTGLVIGWAVVSLPSLAAGILNSPLSHRVFWPNDRSVPWSTLSTVNGVLENRLPLALAFSGFWAIRGYRLVLAKLLAGGIGCLVIADGWRLLQTVEGLHLGRFSSFHFDRMEMLAPFFLTLAGGVGVASCVSALSSRRLRTVLAVTLMAVIVWQSVTVKARTTQEMYHGARYSLLYQHPDVSDLANRIDPKDQARVASVPFRLHPAFAWAYNLETVDGYLNLYSRRYQQFWEQVIKPVTSTDRSVDKYFAEWGNRIYLFPPRDLDVSTGPIRVDAYWRLPLLSLANTRYIISRTPLIDEHLVLLPSRVPDLRRAWIAQPRSRKAMGVFTGEYPAPFRLYIYENTLALDRAFVLYRTRSFATEADLLENLGRATLDELRTTAFIKGAPPAPLGGDAGMSQGAVTVSSHAPDTVVVSATLTQPGFIVITNAYSPYWQARLDGRVQPILPVDHAFQGVFAGAGKHRLELDYIPPYALNAWRSAQ